MILDWVIKSRSPRKVGKARISIYICVFSKMKEVKWHAEQQSWHEIGIFASDGVHRCRLNIKSARVWLQRFATGAPREGCIPKSNNFYSGPIAILKAINYEICLK